MSNEDYRIDVERDEYVVRTRSDTPAQLPSWLAVTGDGSYLESDGTSRPTGKLTTGEPWYEILYRGKKHYRVEYSDPLRSEIRFESLNGRIIDTRIY